MFICLKVKNRKKDLIYILVKWKSQNRYALEGAESKQTVKGNNSNAPNKAEPKQIRKGSDWNAPSRAESK